VDDGGRVRFWVLRFDGAQSEGEYTYEELYDRLRANLAEGSAVRHYLADLRRVTYIDIRL
jgi:hypothetical protein